MYHNYVILKRDFLLFMLSIPPFGKLVVLHIKTLGWRFYNLLAAKTLVDRSNISNNKVFTFSKTFILPQVLFFIKNLFIEFIKAFMELI